MSEDDDKIVEVELEELRGGNLRDAAGSAHQQQNGEIDPDALLQTSDILSLFGVSKMWIWRKMKHDPTFPRPLMISRRRFWKMTEMREWIDAQERA